MNINSNLNSTFPTIYKSLEQPYTSTLGLAILSMERKKERLQFAFVHLLICRFTGCSLFKVAACRLRFYLMTTCIDHTEKFLMLRIYNYRLH